MNVIFDEETGLIVPGEHKLTIEKFEEIFVYNDQRSQIFEGFQRLLEVFKKIACSHLYADGSFVTQKPHPSDIDVCWHMDENNKDKQLFALLNICPQLLFLNEKANREFIQQQFCADVFPANTIEGQSGLMFKDFFQKDKNTGIQKGIIIIDIL
ncbi:MULTISPECIES: DUF6932 family protein [unclassified Sphingobacterium]|uniref:DUF6932 family protein n=1 Tax=unclassified Sphingobacterium TaxID=2609468 RepID=UPI0025E34DB8|nr:MULTISPECIES: hypothetical protein [unclassified Sphingobacterium]